jgi:hypothetical protein
MVVDVERLSGKADCYHRIVGINPPAMAVARGSVRVPNALEREADLTDFIEPAERQQRPLFATPLPRMNAPKRPKSRSVIPARLRWATPGSKAPRVYLQ